MAINICSNFFLSKIAWNKLFSLPVSFSLNNGVPCSTVEPSSTNNSSIIPLLGEGTAKDVCKKKKKNTFQHIF